MALLEDALKWEEVPRLRDELWVEGHQATLLRGRLTQAERQRGS